MTNMWAAFAIAGSNLPFYDILSLLCLDPIFGNHMVWSQRDPVEGKTLGKGSWQGPGP